MPKKRYLKKDSKNKEIARERINILFEQAGEIFYEDKELADRYVQLALELSMKYRVPMPAEFKKRFCKRCRSYLIPSVNLRVRTREGKVVYQCMECKNYMRHPYIKEQKAKRNKKGRKDI